MGRGGNNDEGVEFMGSFDSDHTDILPSDDELIRLMGCYVAYYRLGINPKDVINWLDELGDAEIAARYTGPLLDKVAADFEARNAR